MKPVRKVCPSGWLIPVRGWREETGMPTYRALQLADQAPAPPTCQPPTARARRAAVPASRCRSVLVRAVPSRAHGARPTAAPPRASLLWLLPAPSKRCLRLSASPRGRGKEGRRAGGRAGALRSSQRGLALRRRLSPLRPAGPRVALRSGRVRPRAFALSRALGAAPEGRRSTCHHWVASCAHSWAPGSTGLKVGGSCCFAPTSAQRWTILILKSGVIYSGFSVPGSRLRG